MGIDGIGGRLIEAGMELRRLEAETLTAKAVRDGLIREAYAAGVPGIHTAAGVSAGRVTQICKGIVRGVASSVPDTKIEADAVIDVLSGVPSVALPADVALTPVIRSVRDTRPFGVRSTFWRQYAAGLTLGEVLAECRRFDVRRLYLVGPRPGDGSAESCREWFTGPLRAGWEAAGSYLINPDAPVGRYRHDGGAQVEIHRAASWLGEGDYSTTEASNAMAVVSGGLEAAYGPGVDWLGTPAATGRMLWKRTIPDSGWPVQTQEVRELLHVTAGQARKELMPGPMELPGFAYLDGRLMYSALTWGMPVGEPRHWNGAQIWAMAEDESERLLRGRGRWRVQFTVPSDWQHVGIFMVANSDGGWHYPANPRSTWQTWADGSEVWLAMSHGWSVTVLEGLSWAEGKPLDKWCGSLKEMHHAIAAASDTAVHKLAAGAVRRILLFGIGGFASRAEYARNDSAPIATANPPGGARDLRRVGDTLHWSIPEPFDALNAHPEWAATVWARARHRLLDGPGATGSPNRTGALWIPRENIVAFSTDALYLTKNPGWEDDGKPGRFRLKGRELGPDGRRWPLSWDQVYALRDATGGDQ
jgi:hypothetical protein